jgi:putative endonuclease
VIKQPAVYMVASKKQGTLYTGVTSLLTKRIYEHKKGIIQGFSKKYACKLLVFYELHEAMESAIMREKQIKAGSREKKLQLIETMNPNWKDLYEEII